MDEEIAVVANEIADFLSMIHLAYALKEPGFEEIAQTYANAVHGLIVTELTETQIVRFFITQLWAEGATRAAKIMEGMSPQCGE